MIHASAPLILVHWGLLAWLTMKPLPNVPGEGDKLL